MNKALHIATLPGKSSRLLSLDALRGFDMFWIVCGEGIFHGIAAAIKEKHGLLQSTTDWQIRGTGDLSFFEKIFVGISNQLHHAVWNGFTFYDLVFPLFIFIAGIGMAFSFTRQLGKEVVNKSIIRKKIYRSLVKRTLILLMLGMIVNGLLQWPGYEMTRFASVLGRIALSCFFAALIFLNASLRWQITWCAGLLLLYWAAMTLIPVPGFGAGVLTPDGNLSAWVDRMLLPGKLHRVVYDPEGLLSTIPAISTALLGILTGQWLLSAGQDKKPLKIAALLLLSGIVLAGAGWLWGLIFPINKNIWTSSFVLFAGGWSLLLLALFYFIIDVAGFIKWCRPLVWMGMNSILIYVAAHGLVNFESSSAFLFGGIFHQFPPPWYNALLWTGVAIIQFAGLYWLYKKKLFLKL